MLSDGAQRPGEVAVADTDEEKGGAGPRASKGERPVAEERKEAPQRTTPSTSGGEEDEEMAPPAPVRFPRLESSDRHSFAESVHSVLTSMHHHKLPRWQYRLLVSSVVVLLLVLALLLVVSLLYGFGLQFPQVSVLTTESLAPGLMDAKGAIPLRSLLAFSNPNVFPIYCKPSAVTIYTDPEHAHVLGVAHVPALTLHAHERNHTAVSEYAIEGIMQVPGGPELVKRVLQGKPTLFHTHTVIPLRVKGLGFVPVTRHYEVACRVLKLWPRPAANGTSTATATPAEQGDGDGDEQISVADCHGRFV